MAFVIAVVGLKGGVGKSTIAANLAVALAVRRTNGDRGCLAIDMDPQRTLGRWVEGSRAADRLEVVFMDVRSTADAFVAASHRSYVVIDTPARLGAEARAAIALAHVVLLPVVPGAADVWALRSTIALADTVRARAEAPRVRIVLNRMDRTRLSSETRAALHEMGQVLAAPPVMRAELRARVAYGEAMARGLGVLEHAPRSEASREVRALTNEVLRAARKG